MVKILALSLFCPHPSISCNIIWESEINLVYKFITILEVGPWLIRVILGPKYCQDENLVNVVANSHAIKAGCILSWRGYWASFLKCVLFNI